jgi:tetratricopeptide (TPR) repeat protein
MEKYFAVTSTGLRVIAIARAKFVLILIVLALLCMPALGQRIAVDWDNEGIHLKAQGKYNEAIQAYDRAIEINPRRPASRTISVHCG